MAVQREKPYGAFNFQVDLGLGTDGTSVQAGFVEVILPTASVDVVDYRPGNAKENTLIKLTGPESYTNLVLKRGMTGSLDLYQWYDQVRNGVTGVTRTVVVRLMSEDQSQAVMTWIFRSARPVRYSFSPLNGLDTGPVYETVELAFERMSIE